MDVEVTEIVPGELDVRMRDGTRCRVIVPAGVGIPGVDDETFAAGLVGELLARGRTVPAVVDASSVLRHDPDIIAAVADSAERRRP